MTDLNLILRLLAAALFGAILGSQRERRGKSAGARTYALVTTGSALFTVVSLYGFGGGDPARVAAQIVVGVGFLGAGLILHRAEHVEGLTTAAGIWAASAVGMAVGTGRYLISAVATLILFIVFLLNDDRLGRTPPPPPA